MEAEYETCSNNEWQEVGRGVFERTEIGMPQGGPLSPLLSNIMLSYSFEFPPFQKEKG